MMQRSLIDTEHRAGGGAPGRRSERHGDARSRFSSVSAPRKTARAPAKRATRRSRSQMRIRSRMDAKHEADQTVQALRDLFIGLRAIDAPKTLIFISEGFTLSDLSTTLIELGSAGGGGAHQPVRAAARSGAVRHRGRAHARGTRSRDRQARDRGARHAGGRVARHALQGDRLGRGAVLAHRVRALRLLPARRRIGSARSRRQAASDPRRRAAPRRDRAIAPADSQRAVGRSGGAGRALAAPRDGGRARLAAAVLGAAAARRLVLAAGSGARQGPAADPCRRRDRLPDAESRLGRLRDLRHDRQADRDQGVRRAGCHRS